MATAKIAVEDLTLTIKEEIHVRASIEKTFEALLEQLGPFNEVPNVGPMPMTLEAWPGGRWFRDLGADNGHFWAVVQAIKRPSVLELAGPLFMSYPVNNNLQYRLSEESGGTLITFRHLGLGLIEDQHRKGVATGWASIHARVKAAAERGKPN